MHLKVKHILQKKTKENHEAHKGKFKEVVDFENLEDIYTETNPRRPRTRGLTKQKEQEREPSPRPTQLTFD